MADHVLPHGFRAEPTLVADALRDAAEAALLADVQLELVHEVTAATDLVSVVNEVWGSPPGIDRIDLGVVVALAHSANYVVRARRDGRTLGVAVGFFSPPESNSLHSHIVGVRREAAGCGVGRAIKLHQRAWCLRQRVDSITWTCDPLLARNAWFNITRLGARPVAYLRDLYGPMSDGINADQQTDRMQIDWRLDRPLPEAKAGFPSLVDETTIRRVQVPDDIEGLRTGAPELALHWRDTVRQQLITLLDDGWQVTGFQRGSTQHRAGYVLTRRTDATR